jgi:hypothetical protein
MSSLFDRFRRKKNVSEEEGVDDEVVSEIRAEIEGAEKSIDYEIDAEAAKVATKVKKGQGPGVELIHIGSEPDAREKDRQQLDILGYSNDGTKAYGIYSKDRIHIALFGETGSGKTVTIGQLVYQNILRNEGFMIIDPHGDLAREALAAIPEHLKDRVIYISAMNPQWFGKQIKINPLECKDPKDRHIVAMTFVSALKNMYYKSWGDRLEAILRNGANALVEMEGATLWDLSRLISSPKYLAQVIRTISSPSSINFLQNVLPSYKKDAGTAAYNKMDKILTTPLVAAMFDTQKSSFDMGQAMNDDMFVIVDLSSGMSDDIADFVGSILLNSVYVEAIRRVDIEREHRKPFYLYVDETHRFSPAELQSLLTTVRKFNVKVTLASQTINNFPVDVQRSFGALCKTVILFKSDIATAKMFETVMPITPDELTSLSLNTFAFYSQAQPPVTGIATTKLVLAKNAEVDDWKARAYHSVERFGSEVNMDKYMPAKKKGYVPDWLPMDIKIVYLLRSRRMTKEEIYSELVRRYGDKDVDPEAIDKSIEALRLDHVVNKRYDLHEGTEREILDLDYSAYHRFFDTRMIGARTGKEKHKAAIIYLAETFWNNLTYCKIDLGDAHEQLADIVAISEVQWADSDGKNRYDLLMWGDATAIEIETDPVHREEQVVINYNKNVEQGFSVHYIVFDEKDKETIWRFLTEKRSIAEAAYQVTIMDVTDVERFRKEKLGNAAGETETISGTGGISPEEMKVILAMKNEAGESKKVRKGNEIVDVKVEKSSQQSQRDGVAAGEMTNDIAEVAEDEIVNRIRAAQNHDDLVRIVQEIYPDMPGFEKARKVLEGMGYNLLWTKKGHYLPLK